MIEKISRYKLLSFNIKKSAPIPGNVLINEEYSGICDYLQLQIEVAVVP